MVTSNDWITEERKEFLVDHLKRCDEWADSYDDISREVFAKAREDLADLSP